MHLVVRLASIGFVGLVACSKGGPPAPAPAPVTSSAPAAPDAAPSAAPTPAEADAAAAPSAAPAPAEADAAAAPAPAPAEADAGAAPAPAEADAAAAPAPAEADAGPAPAPTAACIKSDGTAYPGGHEAIEGTVYSFCISDPDAESSLSCFAYDLAAKTMARRPSPPPLPEAAPTKLEGEGWKVDLEAHTASVCQGADCKALDLDGKVPNPEVPASVSADKSMIVLTLEEKLDEPGQPWIYVFDVATQKRLAKQKVGDESNTCGGATFVGNTVKIALNVCAGPGGMAWLASPKNLKKIAAIGGKDFGGYDPQPAHLDGDRWAFLEQGARSVAVQDVVTGKVDHRLDLSEQYPIAYDARDVPADGGTILPAPGGGFVVALAGSGIGRVLVLDATAEKIAAVHDLPRCPAPTP